MADHRSWMYRKPGEKTKSIEEFMKGVEEFLDFAFAHPTCEDHGRIRCPSSKCDFFNYKTREEVQICLLKYGFRSNYMTWTGHGESSIQKETCSSVDTENMCCERELLMEAIGQEFDKSDSHTHNSDSNKFYEKLQAADEPQWEGCKNHTKLSATTRLLYLKYEHNMINKCIDDMLTFIKELLPESEKMPDSYYLIKALMKNLGLSYDSPLANEFCDAYANKLSKNQHPGTNTPIHLVEDPGWRIWASSVGVNKGRLHGRSREKWSQRSKAPSIKLATTDRSYEMNQMRGEMSQLQKKVKKTAIQKKQLPEVLAAQQQMIAVLAAQQQIIAALYVNAGMPPPSLPIFEQVEDSSGDEDDGNHDFDADMNEEDNGSRD